jgi:ketosteroid isomerase-like protein
MRLEWQTLVESARDLSHRDALLGGEAIMAFTRRWFFGLLAVLPLAGRAIAQENPVPAADGSPETFEPSPLAKANVATLHRYMAAMNSGDVPAAGAFFAPDTRNHGKPVGKPGLTRVLTDLRTMFPDYRHEAMEMTAAGDVVIARTRSRALTRASAKSPSKVACWLVSPRPTRALSCSTYIGGASEMG